LPHVGKTLIPRRRGTSRAWPVKPCATRPCINSWGGLSTSLRRSARRDTHDRDPVVSCRVAAFAADLDVAAWSKRDAPLLASPVRGIAHRGRDSLRGNSSAPASPVAVSGHGGGAGGDRTFTVQLRIGPPLPSTVQPSEHPLSNALAIFGPADVAARTLAGACHPLRARREDEVRRGRTNPPSPRSIRSPVPASRRGLRRSMATVLTIGSG